MAHSLAKQAVRRTQPVRTTFNGRPSSLPIVWAAPPIVSRKQACSQARTPLGWSRELWAHRSLGGLMQADDRVRVRRALVVVSRRCASPVCGLRRRCVFFFSAWADDVRCCSDLACNTTDTTTARTEQSPPRCLIGTARKPSIEQPPPPPTTPLRVNRASACRSLTRRHC